MLSRRIPRSCLEAKYFLLCFRIPNVEIDEWVHYEVKSQQEQAIRINISIPGSLDTSMHH